MQSCRGSHQAATPITWMEGKSTAGRSLTGSCWYAIVPKTSTPSISSTVVTGRAMKIPDGFMACPGRHQA